MGERSLSACPMFKRMLKRSVNELILKGTNQSFDTLTTDMVKRITALHFWKQPIWNGPVSALSHPIMFPFGLTDKNGLDQCRKTHRRSFGL